MRNGSVPVVYTTINVQCQCTFVIVIIRMKIFRLTAHASG